MPAEEETLRLPSDFLATAIKAVTLSEPNVQAQGERQYALVPEGYVLEDITDPERLPSRVKETVIVDERRSLSEYVNRFASDATILVADIDDGSITAILDFHGEPDDAAREILANRIGADPAGSIPAATSHLCQLRLRPSEEFKRWDEIEGQMLQQAEFASFLEENACDVLHPEAAVLLEVARDLEATQSVAFKSSVRLDNGDRAFTYENETHTKGDIAIPTKFELEIPLYQGEDAIKLTARLRHRVTPGGLLLGFEWHRVEYLKLSHFKAIATDVVEQTGKPVFYGRRGR